MKKLNETELTMVSGGTPITLDEARFIANGVIDSADHTFIYKNMKFEVTSPNEYFVVGDLVCELISYIRDGASFVDFTDKGPNINNVVNDTWKISKNSVEKNLHSLRINVSRVN